MEIAPVCRYGFVPSPQEESGYGYPLGQVFMLKPLLELILATREDVVKERKNGRWRIGHVGCPQAD